MKRMEGETKWLNKGCYRVCIISGRSLSKKSKSQSVAIAYHRNAMDELTHSGKKLFQMLSCNILFFVVHKNDFLHTAFNIGSLNISLLRRYCWEEIIDMDSWGFEPQASPMPRGRSTADLRAHFCRVLKKRGEIKFMDLSGLEHWNRRIK